MRPRPLAAALPFIFLSSFGLPAALAQPPSTAPSVPADEPAKLDEPDYTAIGLSARQRNILKRAFAAESAGHMEEALELFRKQYYLQPTSPAEAELGLAELRAGHWVVAARRLTHATMDGIFRLNARPIEYLRDKLQEARSHVGTFNVRTNIPDSVVNVDGEVLRDWPYFDMIYVVPGEHTVRVTREGYWSSHLDVEIKAGQTKEVTLGLQPRERETVRNIYRPMNLNVTDKQGEKEPGWVMPVLTASSIGLAFSLGALAVGTYQGSAAEKDKLAEREAMGRDTCPSTTFVENCAIIAEAQARQDKWYSVAIVGGIVGAVSVGGLVLGLVNRPTQPAQITVQPAVGRGGGTLNVTGRF